MTKLLLPLLLLFTGYTCMAEAATASSTMSVSVTVVKPGTLSGQLHNPPTSKPVDGTTPHAPLHQLSLIEKLKDCPSQRFAANDSANKRGDVFP